MPGNEYLFAFIFTDPTPRQDGGAVVISEDDGEPQWRRTGALLFAAADHTAVAGSWTFVVLVQGNI